MAKINTPIPALKLSDGNSIPMLGYGTGTAWFKTGDESKTDDALVQSLETALKLEYYHLDGAEVYKTEPELGTAISISKVPRDKLFITTKVSPNIADIPNALKTSLKKLKLDYVDLYLIHEPFFAKEDPANLQKAWKGMEQMKDEGLAKSIGVSNWLPKHFDAIMADAKYPPTMNQIEVRLNAKAFFQNPTTTFEFHPYLQHHKLIDYHKRYNIATAAYGPLIPVTKAAPGPVDDYLAALAKKYAVNPPEILLRWCIDQDVVAVTTSSKEQRMSDYLRCCTFKLTPKEVQEIRELGEKKSFRQFWTGKFDSKDFE